MVGVGDDVAAANGLAGQEHLVGAEGGELVAVGGEDGGFLAMVGEDDGSPGRIVRNCIARIEYETCGRIPFCFVTTGEVVFEKTRAA